MLEAKRLTKAYRVADSKRMWGYKKLLAVQDVSFRVMPGKTLGLVGESGCGKSTLSRLLTLLESPDEGDVYFEGESMNLAKSKKRQHFRSQVQMVFQNPMNSLNPRMKITSSLSEPLEIHHKPHTSRNLTDLLEQVGMQAQHLNRYPHELSGGERQRVCIARAIALKPQLVICDEAVSSLDVLVRAQILNLLLDLQKRHGLAYLFISHDLRVVRHMSDELLVMQHGRIVESGPAESVFQKPSNAYTQQLLNASSLSEITK